MCSIAECGGKHYARGVCRKHYQAAKKYGAIPLRPARKRPPCSVDGCPRPHKSSGYCITHYRYWKRTGSAMAAPRACSRCGAEFVSVQTKQRMCVDCARARANTSHGISPRLLAVRDGAVCALCGADVDMELVFPNPMCPTVDHIIPVSLGGPVKDEQNTQLAHMRCNVRKGNRLNPGVAIAATL